MKTPTQTAAEIVASFLSRPALTSIARQRKVAAQYAVQFGSDRPTTEEAARLVAAYAVAK